MTLRSIFKRVVGWGGDYSFDLNGEGEVIGTPYNFHFPAANYGAGVALATRSAAVFVPWKHRAKGFHNWASAITAVSPATDPAVDCYRHLPKPQAPTVALESPAVAGLVDDGTHGYAVVNVNSAGVSIPSEVVYVTVSDKDTNGKVRVTIAAGPTGTTARRIYRTLAGATTLTLCDTVNDNTTLTYLDNIADSALSGAVPVVDTSGKTILSATLKLSATDRTKADQLLSGALANGIESLVCDPCMYSLRVLTGASTGAITGLASHLRVERCEE